jgi:cellulose synthase/poly-beta-1,6-N-acetylglucosamine synthase-like glycosyltransferase
MRELPSYRRDEPASWREAWRYRGRAVRPALTRRLSALPFELEAFEGVVDPALLEAVARRAQALDVGGDEVLRAHGMLPPHLIAECIADHLGLPIDPLRDDTPPRHLGAACAGVLARTGVEERRITIAPRGEAIRRLAESLARGPRLGDHFRIAAPEQIAQHVRKICAAELEKEAIYGLQSRQPEFSAFGKRGIPWRLILLAAPLLAAGIFAPGGLYITIEYCLSLSFLSWIFLRLIACSIPDRDDPGPAVPDQALPVYTIIVPLYREERVVGNLIAALKRLDYPREKLDIKLLLEEDDQPTREAIASLALGPPFEIIAPPGSEPRTKPKALAAALPFARGSFVVVYDAEDEPEPDQLRKAIARFFAEKDDLACLQARLAIDNAADSWLSRHFTAEYAGNFDVLLPALASFQLPLPLGGTSNHFRIAALRRVGGWDPFNVTEDADLGMRLARFGYRVGIINSSTWEEAPIRLAQWFRQRTRWFKGWMQTWIVHMRHPTRLLRDLGVGGFLAFQLLIGGATLSALVHPVFLIIVLQHAWTGELFAPAETLEHAVRKSLAITTLLTGYVGTAIFAWVGLRRRRLLHLAWMLPTIPFYWLLLSLAAARALWQLLWAPHRWEKTEHGLARSSVRSKQRRPSQPPHMPPRYRVPRRMDEAFERG